MRNLLILIFLVLSFIARAQTDSIVRIPDKGSKDFDIEKAPFVSTTQDEVFLAVQQMPEFKGGQDSMMKFIYRNLVYPLQAIDNKVEGKVYVKFIVTSTGKIISPKVLSKEKLGYGCEEAAIAVIMKMPNWTPGKQNGQPVSVYYNLPIRFELR